MSGVAWAVGLVSAQRLAELALARRNTLWLLARGGTEAGASHYPLVVVLHIAWLGALIAFVPAGTPVRWAFLVPYILLQPFRLWVIASLGRHWTTRIIILPGARPVRRGPYRFLHHPNYAVVTAEIALLPLAFGAWQIAAIFSAFNALVLTLRIRVENAALAGSQSSHANVYGARSAFERESGA